MSSGAEEVREWLRASWSEDVTVREWWRRLVEAGYAHPTWPAGVGGRGVSAGDARTVLATLGEHGCVAPPTGNLGANLAAPTILERGTADQAIELVRPIALGETAWCQLWSEPAAGSDLAALTTRAEPDGDEWVITGQKVWNSGADQSDIGMLIARTDPRARKHAGITYFAIDMHQPGIEVRPLRVMNGTAPFCEVFLTEARVPTSRIIGDLHGGWDVTRTTMKYERTGTGNLIATGLVSARSGVHGDLDRTVGDVLERARRASTSPRSSIRGGAVPARVMIELARTHGRSEDGVMRQDIARYVTQVKVNGWTNRRIGAAGGVLTGADGSVAKLATSRICQQSRDLAYRVIGPGLLLDGPASPFSGELQRINLASPGNRLGGGSDEIQMNTIGERALGLPREPG